MTNLNGNLNDSNANSAEVERAKEIARGPLGKELSKYPIMFAASVNIIEEPTNLRKSNLFNGTATLIELDGKHMALTCDHVLQKYDKIIREGKSAQLQIGNLIVDPSNCMVDRSDEMDIAALDLESYNWSQISLDKKIGDKFVVPLEWPPTGILALISIRLMTLVALVVHPFSNMTRVSSEPLNLLALLSNTVVYHLIS